MPAAIMWFLQQVLKGDIIFIIKNMVQVFRPGIRQMDRAIIGQVG